MTRLQVNAITFLRTRAHTQNEVLEIRKALKPKCIILNKNCILQNMFFADDYIHGAVKQL
jgi:hypothetical protein